MTMSLAAIYEANFGKAAAEVKKAAPEAAVAEAPVAEAPAAEAGAEMTDEQLDKALEGMTDEQLQALAKEVATETKSSQAAAAAESEKLAEEYFAAGRIFAQGFMNEVNGGEKVAQPATENVTAVQKFAALLEMELQAK
jgi:hypothetical protein